MTYRASEAMLEALRELRGTVCRCGQPKVSGHSFCRECYFLLPDTYRRRLYLPAKRGYHKAFGRAVAWLRDHHDPFRAREGVTA